MAVSLLLCATPLAADVATPEQVEDLAAAWVSIAGGFDMSKGAVFAILQKGETSFRLDHIQSITQRGRLILIEYRRSDDPKIYRATFQPQNVLIISE